MSFHITKHILKAKKAQRCCETRTPINVGDPYVRFTGVHDGDFYTVAMLPQIEEMYNRRNNDAFREDGEGICFGDLIEDITGCLEGNERDQDIKDAELFVSLLRPDGGSVIRELLEAAKARKASFMLTDTPITNAAVTDGWSSDAQAVDPEVSRALERKLNYATELLTKCRQQSLNPSRDLLAKIINFFNLP